MNKREVEILIKTELAKSLVNYIGRPYDVDNLKIIYDEVNKISITIPIILPEIYDYTISVWPSIKKIKYICY